jgi:NitT/TauT family transport system permease protein
MSEHEKTSGPGRSRSLQRGLVRFFTSKQVLVSLSLLGFLVVWELFVVIFGIRAYILPRPTEIAVAIVRYLGSLLRGSAYTVRSMLLGYAIAAALGLLIALPIAFSRIMQRTVYPLLVISQLVPKVALAPIFVIWFGFGLLPKIMIVFLLSFFPVLLNSIVALKSIDPEIIYLARSTGASRLDMFLKVRLPNSMPTIFAGLKLAAISATIGAVIGEFIGSDSGLGYIILTAQGDLQTDLSFSAIVILTVLGFLLYYGVESVERISIPWHISQRDERRESA